MGTFLKNYWRVGGANLWIGWAMSAAIIHSLGWQCWSAATLLHAVLLLSIGFGFFLSVYLSRK